MDTQFYDVFVTEGENPTFAYRTGLTAYTEGLRDGIFTALGWNGAGYMALAQDGCDATILNPGGLYRAAGVRAGARRPVAHAPLGVRGLRADRGERQPHLQNHTAPYRPSPSQSRSAPCWTAPACFRAGWRLPTARAVARRAGQARRPQRRAGDDAALEKPCEGPERRQPLPARLL